VARSHVVARSLVVACSLVAVFALGACGRRGSARLEGHWKGTRADGVAPEAQARANDFATQTELDVHGDTLTVTFPKDKQSGRYRVVSETKAAVVIVTDKDGDSDKQTFTFVDEKTLRWTVLDGKTITFAKQ
jgi:hypothetical protein